MSWKKFIEARRIEFRHAITTIDDFNEVFDAVYIPTRRNPWKISSLLNELIKLSMSRKIYVLPTDMNDVGQETCSLIDENKDIEILSIQSIEKSTWDLPNKRNFAVSHATANEYKKVLLLDDDINVVDSKATLKKILKGLDRSRIAGAYSTGEIDTSLVGTVAIKVGLEEHCNFISGNCMGINLNESTPYFPNVYNEDWLAIFEDVINEGVLLVGPIEQTTRKTDDYWSTAYFQEFGEIIADELYSNLSGEGEFFSLKHILSKYFDEAIWENVLLERKEWLQRIGAKGSEGRLSMMDQQIIRGASERLLKIKPNECVAFLKSWRAGLDEVRNRMYSLKHGQSANQHERINR